MAKDLAEFLLDDETRIVRLDMSEYTKRHEVSKMIGAPPGYTGYGEGGQLTDAQGRTVSFRNTILIGTSNLGTESLSPEKRPIGFIQSATPDYREARQLVLHEIKKFFKPEFINRLDDTIVFHYLEEEHIKQIARLFVDELVQRMQGRDISINVDEQVIDLLARDGFDLVYGARPLRREVERQVENPLAMMIVRGECPDGSQVNITVKDNKIAFDVRQNQRP